MKSSKGAYWQKLDHVRGVAALLVFSWHFAMHLGPDSVSRQTLIYLQGQMGVSLFMVLSGYLFTKLLINQKNIVWRIFWLNRILRITPVLLLSFVLSKISTQQLRDTDADKFVYEILRGFFYGNWPNAAWSVSIEIQFYFLLPALLLGFRFKFALPALVALSVTSLIILYDTHGFVRPFAYNFLFGRIAQLVLGMLVFRYREEIICKKRWLLVIVGASFILYFLHFNHVGGFEGTYKSKIWIFGPLIEGITFAFLILVYDNSSKEIPKLSRMFLKNLGEVSFSFYLLHQFVLEVLFSTPVIGNSNFPILITFCIAFGITFVVSYTSYNLIEKPWLKMRKSYVEKN